MQSGATLFVVLIIAVAGGMFFNYILWFRYDTYLSWMMVINKLYKRVGFPRLFTDAFLRSPIYKWYVRITFLIGLCLCVLLLLLPLLVE